MKIEEYRVSITQNYWMILLSNVFLLEQRATDLSDTNIKQYELKIKQINLVLILITLLMMIIIKPDQEYNC